MNGNFWTLIIPNALTAVVAMIGYMSLRYKASAENVANLETTIAALTKRVTAVEKENSLCQEERRELVQDKEKLTNELAQAKQQLTTAALVKEAEEKLAVKASMEENTELTVQAVQAVQALAEKVDKIVTPTATSPMTANVGPVIGAIADEVISQLAKKSEENKAEAVQIPVTLPPAPNK